MENVTFSDDFHSKIIYLLQFRTAHPTLRKSIENVEYNAANTVLFSADQIAEIFSYQRQPSTWSTFYNFAEVDFQQIHQTFIRLKLFQQKSSWFVKTNQSTLFGLFEKE